MDKSTFHLLNGKQRQLLKRQDVMYSDNIRCSWYKGSNSCETIMQRLPGLRSAGLLRACYRPTCLRVWLASLDIIQLPCGSTYTSSASLLVEWRMKNSRGTRNSSNKMNYLKTFFSSREQNASRHSLQKTKTKNKNKTKQKTKQIQQQQQNKTARLHRTKCVGLNRDHSAHRVYLNSRAARDKLIFSNSFGFFL